MSKPGALMSKPKRWFERLPTVELGYLEHDIADGVSRARVAYLDGRVIEAKRYAREVIRDAAIYIRNRRGTRGDRQVKWARTQSRIAKNLIKLITERR